MVSCLRRVFDDHGPTAIAQALMCMNLIELALWLLFLLNSRLRAAFVQTLGDLRVQLLLAFLSGLVSPCSGDRPRGRVA